MHFLLVVFPFVSAFLLVLPPPISSYLLSPITAIRFDMSAIDTLESAHKAWQSGSSSSDTVTVASGQYSYSVNMAAMTQTNSQHAQHTVREVRRVSLL